MLWCGHMTAWHDKCVVTPQHDMTNVWSHHNIILFSHMDCNSTHIQGSCDDAFL